MCAKRSLNGWQLAPWDCTGYLSGAIGPGIGLVWLAPPRFVIFS
jgi:hypothetical protein